MKNKIFRTRDIGFKKFHFASIRAQSEISLKKGIRKLKGEATLRRTPKFKKERNGLNSFEPCIFLKYLFFLNGKFN